MSLRNSVLEVVALRRAGADFYKLLFAVPQFARDSIVRGPIASHQSYCARFFDEIDYKPDITSVLYRRGKLLHRRDGPAVECSDGTYMWFYNESLHRDWGPAVLNTSGEEEYYIHGRQVPRPTSTWRIDKIKFFGLQQVTLQVDGS